MFRDEDDSFNIVAIEGGGVKGGYAARVIRRVAKARPNFFARTSLMAGTSTGAILALALAHGLTPAECEALYVEHAGSIFRKKPFGGFWGAKYSADGLRKVLEDTFGKTQLRQLDRHVIAVSYDLDAPATQTMPRGGRPRIFEPVDDGRELVVDVALASSAAPTYFPAHQSRYIDGGLVANNPVSCAVVEALRLGVPPERLRILSIGTGFVPHVIKGGNYGIVRWALKGIIDIAINGSAGVHETNIGTVFGKNAHNLESQLPRDIELDEVAALPELLAAADAVDLAPTLKWLDESGWV